MKSCQVFFRKTDALVFTQHVTKSGLGISAAPMLKVPPDSPVELGEAVLKCLEASSSGVPDPQDYSELAKEMLRFAGERSWKRFASNTILRGVWRTDSNIKIVPFDARERGSFEQREDLSREIPSSLPAELGRSLLASLNWK